MPRVFGQAPKITSAPLGGNLFLLSGAGENVISHTGPDGVILVDGGLKENAGALAQAVAALPNGAGKIHTLFNTHWHPQQTGSNEKLGAAGATIIAQENTRLWLQQNITWPWNGQKFQKLAKAAQPNKTFYDNGSLESGVKYGYVSDAAHTDGDLYVYFPQQNVLAVGGVTAQAATTIRPKPAESASKASRPPASPRPPNFLKAVRKLRGRVMPPPGSKQPDGKAVDSLVAWLEDSLDKVPRRRTSAIARCCTG